MKNSILRYGAYSSLTLVTLFVLSFIFGPDDHRVMEKLGYLSILISLIFVFLGMRQYRDEVMGGHVSFGQALKVGLLIATIPSIVFGIFDVIYVEFINPDFMENFYNTTLAEMKANMTPEQYAVESEKMESQKAMFQNPAAQFFIMGLTVFLVGIVVAVVSAFVLKREVATT